MGDSIRDELEKFLRNNKAFRKYIRELVGLDPLFDQIDTSFRVIDGGDPPIFSFGGNNNKWWPVYDHWPIVSVGIEWVLEQFLSCKFANEE